jgi:mannosyltransferase
MTLKATARARPSVLRMLRAAQSTGRPARPAPKIRPEHRGGTGRLRRALVPAIPALAELVVGGYRLGGPSLWRDEGYTINSAQRSIGQIMALIYRQDAVHGLYYLLMHVVMGAFGASAVAIRLPSLLAMSVTAAVTAAVGARLARASALPAPSVTGIAAGLLVVALPLTTYYVEDARPYGLVSMFALISTYALVRGATERSWSWWSVYAAAITLTVALDVFALLLVAAQGLSLVFARMRAPGRALGYGPGGALGYGPGRALGSERADQQGGDDERPGPAVADAGQGARAAVAGAVPDTGLAARPVAAWLTATCAALILLAPVIYLAYRQADTLSWIKPPRRATVIGLLKDLAGSGELIPLVAVLALCGVVTDRGLRRRGGLTLAVVALPWLVLPPLLLLTVSVLHPVYTERYVLFSFPALALLAAAGLSRLADLAALLPLGRRSRLVAALPSVLLAVLLAVALTGPQLAIRITGNRTDDLRTVSAIVAAQEQPGDAVLYLPQTTRVVGMAYPAPFRRLRDIALGQAPASSATLLGVEVSAPVLDRRLAGVRRVWTVNWQNSLTSLTSDRLADQEEARLSHMRLVMQWYVMSVVLSLYTAGSPAS